MPKTFIPDNWQPDEKLRAWCKANNFDADLHAEYFVDYCEANAVKYANFDAAFRNCCRGDWGNVRRNASATYMGETWKMSDDATIKHGLAKGLPARRGETMIDYRKRLERS
jgi:hypothetical protein